LFNFSDGFDNNNNYELTFFNSFTKTFLYKIVSKDKFINLNLSPATAFNFDDETYNYYKNSSNYDSVLLKLSPRDIEINNNDIKIDKKNKNKNNQVLSANDAKNFKFGYNFDVTTIDDLNFMFKHYTQTNGYLVNVVVLRNKYNNNFYLHALTSTGKQYLNQLQPISSEQNHFKFGFKKSSASMSRLKSLEYWNILKYETMKPKMNCSEYEETNLMKKNSIITKRVVSTIIECADFDSKAFFDSHNKRRFDSKLVELKASMSALIRQTKCQYRCILVDYFAKIYSMFIYFSFISNFFRLIF
jgi:hypothetical protein